MLQCRRNQICWTHTHTHQQTSHFCWQDELKCFPVAVRWLKNRRNVSQFPQTMTRSNISQMSNCDPGESSRVWWFSCQGLIVDFIRLVRAGKSPACAGLLLSLRNKTNNQTSANTSTKKEKVKPILTYSNKKVDKQTCERRQARRQTDRWPDRQTDGVTRR